MVPHLLLSIELLYQSLKNTTFLPPSWVWMAFFLFLPHCCLLPESAGESLMEEKKDRNRGDDRGRWVNLPAPPVARLSVCEVNERPTPLYCCLSPQLKLSGRDRLAASLISALFEILPSSLNSNTLLICHKSLILLMASSTHNALSDLVELFNFVVQKLSRDAWIFSH